MKGFPIFFFFLGELCLINLFILLLILSLGLERGLTEERLYFFDLEQTLFSLSELAHLILRAFEEVDNFFLKFCENIALSILTVSDRHVQAFALLK